MAFNKKGPSVAAITPEALKTSGAQEDEILEEGPVALKSAIHHIMPELQVVCEGGPMTMLVQKLISSMPRDKAEADAFITQLRRLKDAGERAYAEGLAAYFALVKQ